jgi:hypothetical protein
MTTKAKTKEVLYNGRIIEVYLKKEFRKIKYCDCEFCKKCFRKEFFYKTVNPVCIENKLYFTVKEDEVSDLINSNLIQINDN